MIQLSVTITALSPLCFSERRQEGRFRFSLDHVSRGSAAGGGGVAHAACRSKSTTPTFQRLFGVGQPPAALFRCAYPGVDVLPHTALSCKDNLGFLASGTGHGVFDTLVDRLCFEQLQPPGLLYRPRCAHENCDPGRVEAFTGFYSREGESYHSPRSPSGY